MATNRKLVFRNEELYHIFNRGIEKRPVFTSRREYARAKELIRFYQYSMTPIRFSQFLLQSKERQEELWKVIKASDKLIEIVTFCFMPNHFHFLLKQKMEKGIPTFIANFTNSYTKYFNLKNDRFGPLFEGVFKAVYIEDDEQLIHLSRYIHLNPVVSSLIEPEELENYEWSSYIDYISSSDSEVVAKDTVVNMFKSVEEYKKFVLDQVDYGKKLELIKHLILE